jgi:hypothetical protein
MGTESKSHSNSFYRLFLWLTKRTISVEATCAVLFIVTGNSLFQGVLIFTEGRA